MTAKPRGFAALKNNNPDRLREIAQKGGSSVPADKRAFAVDAALASEAGRLGGMATARQVRVR